MTRTQFIEEIAKYVQKHAPKYNIKVYSPIIAQACLESTYGTSELAKNAHNYFGLKYKPGRCPTASGIYYKVGSEQNEDGSYSSSAMQWCKFDSIEDCVIGYLDFINISRYSNLKGETDPKKYLEKIKADGYATSLKYVDNVYKDITSNDLTKYDPKVAITTKYFRVQVGSFSLRKNAEALQAKLKKDGYSAIIKKYGILNRVQVGAFSKRENANNLMSELKAKGYSAFVTYC